MQQRAVHVIPTVKHGGANPLFREIEAGPGQLEETEQTMSYLTNNDQMF